MPPIVPRITHPDRVLYPAPRLTKIDLARYYAQIGDWIVPDVEGRPLTLVRCPKGIRGECFFMKHSQVWAPAPLRRVQIQEKTKVGEYLIADTIEAVVGLVQMGILEIHTWNSAPRPKRSRPGLRGRDVGPPSCSITCATTGRHLHRGVLVQSQARSAGQCASDVERTSARARPGVVHGGHRPEAARAAHHGSVGRV